MTTTIMTTTITRRRERGRRSHPALQWCTARRGLASPSRTVRVGGARDRRAAPSRALGPDEDPRPAPPLKDSVVAGRRSRFGDSIASRLWRSRPRRPTLPRTRLRTMSRRTANGHRCQHPCGAARRREPEPSRVDRGLPARTASTTVRLGRSAARTNHACLGNASGGRQRPGRPPLHLARHGAGPGDIEPFGPGKERRSKAGRQDVVRAVPMSRLP